jgi:prepilin-type N-terminal cleavage/methylation domain-containing protein
MGGREAMMTFRTGSKRSEYLDEPRRRSAFTLIELILVMAMLLIVLGVAFPSLKGFLRGRNHDTEARRYLALTQYGQSRAVSEGVPMVLWIDERRGAYGLQVQPGYTDSDHKAVEFTLGDGLQVEVQGPAVRRGSAQLNRTIPGVGNVPAIRFTPDGFLGDISPTGILFRQGVKDSVWIVESTNRLNYEIEANHASTGRL